MSELNPRLDQRVAARSVFGCWRNVPVVFGDVAEPTISGKRGGWFTRGGTPVRHPSAYAKRGWSNLVYRRDSRVITIPR
jgi:hypothetical protein